MDGADIDDDDNEDDDDGDPGYPWHYPKGICAKIWWLCFLPLNLLFFITIPDVRRPSLVKVFPLTFLMSVAWIGKKAKPEKDMIGSLFKNIGCLRSARVSQIS